MSSLYNKQRIIIKFQFSTMDLAVIKFCNVWIFIIFKKIPATVKVETLRIWNETKWIVNEKLVQRNPEITSNKNCFVQSCVPSRWKNIHIIVAMKTRARRVTPVIVPHVRNSVLPVQCVARFLNNECVVWCQPDTRDNASRWRLLP